MFAHGAARLDKQCGGRCACASLPRSHYYGQAFTISVNLTEIKMTPKHAARPRTCFCLSQKLARNVSGNIYVRLKFDF